MRICLVAGCLLAPSLPAASPAARASVKSVVRGDAQGRLVRRMAVVPAPGVTRAEALEALGLSPAAIDALVERLAGQYGVDPALVQAVIRVESGYDAFAVSHKGAQGLMQLMPPTARRLSVKNAFSPVENIEAGVRHLKGLLERYGGQVEPAVAAYNAGAGAVERYGGIPPYRETQDYVAKVGRKYSEAKQAAIQKKKKQSETAGAPPRIEQFEDAQGTLHIRTISTP